MTTSPAAAELPSEPARFARSRAYMNRAERVLARGVASSARLRREPIVLTKASGSRFWDIDGNEYVDCILGLGPAILGHSPPTVVERLTQQLDKGFIYAAQHEGEAELAERIVEMVPSAEVVVFSTSGSEAVHTALRIARATSGRRMVVKFEGHYHGSLENIFVSAPGSAPELAGRDHAPGVPAVPGETSPGDVVVTRWNDLEALRHTLDAHRGQVAAVIMEPVPGFGWFIPSQEYLTAVRDLCAAHGALLIFDEVLSGFRLAAGGAQEWLGVTPDMTVVAKAIASGLPISAVCGTRAAMASATTGAVRHAGTYNGSPLSVVAALATVEEIRVRGPGLYELLERLGARLQDGLQRAAEATGAPLVVNRAGSAFQLFWDPTPPTRTYEEGCTSDADRVAELSDRVLVKGVHTMPRGMLVLSAAHSDADIDHVVDAHAAALAEMVDATP